jgi:hypothetical protein
MEGRYLSGRATTYATSRAVPGTRHQRLTLCACGTNERPLHSKRSLLLRVMERLQAATPQHSTNVAEESPVSIQIHPAFLADSHLLFVSCGKLISKPLLCHGDSEQRRTQLLTPVFHLSLDP